MGLATNRPSQVVDFDTTIYTGLKVATYQTSKDTTGRTRIRAILRVRVNGKTVNRSRTFDSKEAAEDWALTAEARLRELQGNESVSLSKVFSTRIGYSGERVAKVYRTLANSFLGGKTLETITKADILLYLAKRIEDGAGDTEIMAETSALVNVLAEANNAYAGEEHEGQRWIEEALRLIDVIRKS